MLEGASLTPKQVHAFCDHVELLIRARLYDAQTFTLLTDPQSIMAISLRFMTSKGMERVPVLNWKTGWEVSTILEALRECYPPAALDNLVSTYDKWYTLYKCMRTTITVDQNNIALTRKLFSEQLISAWPTLATCQFEKMFTYFHNPRKDYGSNRMLQNDLKEALEKDAAKSTPGAYSTPTCLPAGLQVRPRRQEQQVQDHPLLQPCRQASPWQQWTWRFHPTCQISVTHHV
jgi:hypothetical protein